MANLWFSSWTPTSAGATFGACVGLFFLAVFARVLAVVSAGAAQAWHDSLLLEREAALALALASSTSASSSTNGSIAAPSKPASLSSAPELPREARLATRREVAVAPPFKLAHDLPRGFLFMFSAFVNYLLMLSVMTYDVWFFLAVLIGLGVGECAFGRFAPKHPHDALH